MQENSGEIPAGSLPRTMDIILRHEIVEQARAGDKYVFLTVSLLLCSLKLLDYGESERRFWPQVHIYRGSCCRT